jgi:manganese oxidase
MREERSETRAGVAGIDTQSPNGHAVTGHHMHETKPDVTRPQLAAVGLLTVLALVASVLVPAMFVNLTYSAEEVGGAVMPPGMVMSRDTPAAAMREMAAVDPGEVSYEAPAEARGDRALEPRIDGGVKVFDLGVSVIEWNILPDQSVEAYAFNRQVPGPRIRVTEGDRVRINVTNELPEATSVHWHGMVLPNGMDGAAEVTQRPIEPGETFAYEFTAGQAGTYFYHSHKEPDRQQGLGMYGALIVDPKDPARDAAYDYDHEMVVSCRSGSRGTATPTRP